MTRAKKSRPSYANRGALGTTLRLAFMDLAHEWRVSFCLILALAAVLAPLLVLFGLKSGIVSTMRERLLADPRNLEIIIAGSYRLEPDWFAALSKADETGFLMPKTRSLAATIDLSAGSGHSLPGVEMIPTGPGDPLLRGLAPPEGGNGVLLSHSAARQLGAPAGTTLTGLLARNRQGERQVVRIALEVKAILPESAFGRDGIFVPLPLLVAAEDFRDGKDEAEASAADAARAFASARLFARDLDAVGPLADRLRGQGMEVRTHADEIETVRAIDRTLTVIFTVIAAIAVLGYLLSLASSLWANVERKRKELALLRLVGFPTMAIVAFPAIQAATVAAIGLVLSSAIAWAVGAVFNRVLAGNLAREEFVCRLLPGDLAAAGVLTVILAIIASSLGGYRALRIDPAESLRDL